MKNILFKQGPIRHLTGVLALTAILTGLVWGEQAMTQKEILSVLRELTREPFESWLDTGEIQARHEEFKTAWIDDPNQLEALIEEACRDYLADVNKSEQTEELQQEYLRAIPFNIRYEQGNEFKMISRETIWRDRGRFVWDQQVLERQDSVVPPDDGNSMYDYFNIQTNGHRINSWDGKHFVLQNPQVDSAQIFELGLGMGPATNGPERAGITPWGRGIYTYDSLSKKTIAGIDRGKTVELSIQIGPDHHRKFVLDKTRRHALLELVVTTPRATSIYQYNDYIQFEGSWIPRSIRYDTFRTLDGNFKLTGYHLWTFERIAPLSGDFQFTRQFEDDTLVQYQLGRGRSYRYLASATGVDTGALLQKKLQIASRSGDVPRNCATLCAETVLMRLNRPVGDEAGLIEMIDLKGKTRLFDLAGYLQKRQLTTRAVVAPLKDLIQQTQCQVVLNFPQNHFCLLGPVDDRFVRLIDLSQSDFFYRIDRDVFEKKWESRTALIVSTGAISVPPGAKPVDDETLKSILGSQSAACSHPLQDYKVILCPPAQLGECQGYYKIFYERWGCSPDTEGICSEERLLLRSYAACQNDDYYPDQCTVSGDWVNYYRQACR